MPDRPTTRHLRALRGTAAAAIATTLASTGHTIGGGTPPPLWLLMAVTVLAAPVSVALVGGRRSFLRLAAAIAAAQIFLHAAFAAVGSLSPLGGGAHEHPAMPMPMPMLANGGAPHTMGHLSPAMLCGHILAGLVTIALVAYGEQLLVVIARGIRRLLTRPQAAVPAVHPRVPVLSPVPRLAHAARFLTALTRRGPPPFAR